MIDLHQSSRDHGGVTRLFWRLLSVLVWFAAGACGTKYDPSLPDSAELGTPRGYRVARVITHFHSPYSYDACDRDGFPGGTINLECLHHLKAAACTNRVDFLFLTDHPSHMAEYEMSDLILPEASDRVLVDGAGAPVANRLGSCPDGFAPTVLPGFEGKVIALGMTKHLDSDKTIREDLYSTDTAALTGRLNQEANAIVVVPHTEGKTVEWIRSVGPQAIEIYNFHANIDPKIRLRDLKLPPFEVVPGLLTYLLDPWHSLNPDYGFINFVQLHLNYFQKWDQLVAGGTQMTGLAGTDSHENVFPQKVEDGERLDGHRRVMRFFSNHYLVSTLDPDSVKDAIRHARGWIVFEGFGSPVGMDFFAIAGTTTAGVGETVTIPPGGKVELYVTVPTLHPRSPHGDDAPEMRVRLRRVSDDATETLVGESDHGNLYLPTVLPGAYRAEISITPRHLKPFLGDFEDQADREFVWIVTNHIIVKP